MSTQIPRYLRFVRTPEVTELDRTVSVFSCHTCSVVLYGFVFFQTCSSLSGYPNDTYLLRILVELIAVLDTTSVGVFTDALRAYMIAEFPVLTQTVETATGTFATNDGLAVATVFLVHMFYARRLVSLTEGYVVPAIVGVLSTASFVLGLGGSIPSYHIHAIRDSFPAFSIPTFSIPTFSIPTFSIPTFSIPTFSIPTLSIPTYSIPTYSIPTFSIPTFSIPTFSIPTFSIPTFSIPTFSIPTFSIPTFNPFSDTPIKAIAGACQGLTALTSILTFIFVAYFTARNPSVVSKAKPLFDQISIWLLVYGGAATIVQLLYFAVIVQSVRHSPTPTSELELAEERAKCARLEKECQKAKVEADALAETNCKLEDKIREDKELLEEREKEVGQKDASIQRLEKEANEMQAKSRTAVAHTQELSTRLSEKEKLLSDRTTELTVARAFLTRVDAVSEAEVVGMAENLNALISDATGALSDTWDQREPVLETLVEDSDLKQVRDYLGNLMFEQVAARNFVAVTLAVEMCLAQFIDRVTSGWGGGDVAGTLGEIYGMISTKEGQTIASRWRTLTKRYSPHQESPRSEEIIRDLARILMLTRSFSDLSEAIDSVGNSAGTGVEAIIEATLQFDHTIKTKVASSDISVYIVPPGATFSEEAMVDEFGKDGATEEAGECRVVAGTREIGLLQKLDNVEKVLRKPKVILERDLPESQGESED